jgi:uncharacterized protein (UPF0371 family)
MEKGFDNALYVKIQSEKIRERFGLFDKLYLEIGGKLFEDTHAARVLPGFKSNAKISMFQELKKDLEIIYCINANDIERNKTRADYGITYDKEIERLINQAKDSGFSVNSVVITLYKNQPSVDTFIKKLNRQNIKTYIHTFTKGYPTDVNTIVSDEGYGANPYIKTTKKLILVNAPGPGSGKLATCLSQLYHEHKMGVNAGYAKYETFPVWDLPLTHPVNVAYEAATADLHDINMIDPFHLEKYNIKAVNYNRDIELFPVLKSILFKITGRDIYYSPTDMGVNMIGSCITSNEVLEDAGKKEIIRRYFNEMKAYKLGLTTIDIPNRIKILMNQLNIDRDYFDIIKIAEKKSSEKNSHIVSIKLNDGRIITGKETDLLSPISSCVINAIKELSNIPDKIKLLPKNILEPIRKIKNIELHDDKKRLELSEVLIALSICSVTNPTVENALDHLKELSMCDAYSKYIVPDNELKTLKKLDVNLICEPKYYSENDFIY